MKKSLEEKIEQISLDIKNIRLSFRAQRNLLASEILQRNSNVDQHTIEKTLFALLDNRIKQLGNNLINTETHQLPDGLVVPSSSTIVENLKDNTTNIKSIPDNSKSYRQTRDNDNSVSYKTESTLSENKEEHEVDEINAIEDEIILALKRLEEIKPISNSISKEK